MDAKIIDYVKDKRMSDFSDAVKSELRKKIMGNTYIKSRAENVEQFSKISDTLGSLRASINIGI